MEVVQQDSQVLLAVSIGYEHGHPVTGSTLGGVVVTPGLQTWVQPHDLRQIGGVSVGCQGADWNLGLKSVSVSLTVLFPLNLAFLLFFLGVQNQVEN